MDYSLEPHEAFGESGWLRKRKGQPDNNVTITKEEFDKNNKWKCYSIPNTFVLKQGGGVNLNTFAGKVRTQLMPKKYRIISDISGSGIYAVMYAGHFYVKNTNDKGRFKVTGSDSYLIGYESIKDHVPYKIAAFAGVGCHSGAHSWHIIANKLWVTNYFSDVQFLNKLGLESIFSGGDETLDARPTFGGYFGNTGIRLQAFLTELK